jgi:hypothetical protein
MAQVTVGSILPVGTIIHSMLTIAQFQTQYGTNWVLADGSSCTGTKYASVTGATTVPDMRGKFLRGKNNGASGANYNPDGDLSLGTYTADKYLSHTHTIGDNIPGAVFGYGIEGISGSGAPRNSGASGGNETAPKSITVNIFIRVN